jgi:hypothetical protein
METTLSLNNIVGLSLMVDNPEFPFMCIPVIISYHKSFMLQAWYKFNYYYVAFFSLEISILNGAFAARILDLTTFLLLVKTSGN